VVVTKDEIVVGIAGAVFSKVDFRKRPRVVMQEIMRVLEESM
jgi:hypothetical protein